MKQKLVKILPLVYIVFLTVLILGPLLRSGYVFLLDFVMSPEYHINFKTFLSGQGIISNLPFKVLVYILAYILPTYIVQKIILISAFLFSGLAFWRVIPKKFGVIPCLIATTFYVINPFVYERFTAGHIGVLLGYAIFPLTLQAIFKAYEEKTWRSIIYLVLLWTLQIIFAAHYLMIVGVCVSIVFIAYTVMYIIKLKKDNRKFLWKNIVFSSPLHIFLKIILVLAIVNSFWWLPSVIQKSNAVSAINTSHFIAYQSSPDNRYGLLMNLTGMYGFWRERTAPDEFILAKDNLPVWPLFLVIFLVPIFFGIRGLIKEKKYVYADSLLAMGFVAVILSVGPQYGFIGSINKFIFSYIPAFKGLRESQKFISILVLAYSLFIAYGLYYLKDINKNKIIYYLISIVVFVNIFIYNYPLLWAANNQLDVKQYPYSYQKAKQIFDHDHTNYKILIMPWHMYVIGHSLTPNRTIADPAPKYFYTHKSKLLFSQDEEAGYLKDTTPAEAAIGAWQRAGGNKEDWHSLLSSLGVKYIFVTKVTDINKHGFDYSIFLNNKDFSVLVQDNYALLFKGTVAK